MKQETCHPARLCYEEPELLEYLPLISDILTESPTEDPDEGEWEKF